MVVAAHADDEVLGCGGALVRHAKKGDKIGALFLTDGVGSRQCSGSVEVDARNAAMKRALQVLGVSYHQRLDFPDNELDTVPLLRIVRSIERFCNEWGQPDILYVHHPEDLNIDHEIAFRAAMTCFRPQPSSNCKPAIILAFEVLSSTGWKALPKGDSFTPNYFVDISSTLELKLEALEAYVSEMREWPHSRSIEAVEHLAHYRGASIGLSSAEAFEVVRMIS